MHVFFCEPTLFPSMLIGMASERFNNSNVGAFGLTGMSAAEGLACASPSGLISRLCRNHLAGDFTVRDASLFDYMRMLKEAEDIFIEPSSCAAFTAPVNILKYESGRDYFAKHGLDAEKLANCTQLCWATGGRLVPDEIWEKYMNTYME